ncbi:hypothetical protein Lnau_1555 [Legionella nautarum]|uniref:Uncharacterized protein n=1 Tax=Legionella nautarum TaxID=45070 RepID=A0A0W0WW73_9GAMM|nr:hypothetical protein [Legionella nautarum]KTD36571.1 hypothetical protein Lnau_1555 [Legionella nautarum]
MPFNIELRQSNNKVIVKLQVVRKVINVYFTGKVEDIVKERKRWIHLEKHFVSSIPEVGPEAGVSYTTDAYHHKKEHTNNKEYTETDEQQTYHLHRQFKVEVTPALLSTYLHEFWHQQTIHGGKFRFLTNSNEVGSIIKTFSVYYESYKNSSLELEYEKDNELTGKELNEFIEKAKEVRLSRLFASQNSPVFASQPLAVSYPEDKASKNSPQQGWN